MAPDGALVSPWVARFAPLIPAGRVLDLACGSGRHAHLLADAGRAVLAVDRDAAVLAALSRPHIETECIDLEKADAAVDQLLRPERFAGIVVTNYLHRPLLPAVFASLADGGVLIYETFADGNQRFGKPSNPAFLLRPGELLDACRAAPFALHVLAYENGCIDSPKPAQVQRLCAVRGDIFPIDVALHL